mmetsp:Transcript_20152/g.51320  ORF Transcript_20152/g.51320 Transcript_20152/m.51320 type:complete len:87 (+) Transcript_20152:172-432(+)
MQLCPSRADDCTTADPPCSDPDASDPPSSPKLQMRADPSGLLSGVVSSSARLHTKGTDIEKRRRLAGDKPTPNQAIKPKLTNIAVV